MKKVLKSVLPIVASTSLFAPLVSMTGCSEKYTFVVGNKPEGLDEVLVTEGSKDLIANHDITVKCNLRNLQSYGNWDKWCIWLDNVSGSAYPDIDNVEVKSLIVHRQVPKEEGGIVVYEVKNYDITNLYTTSLNNKNYEIIFERNNNESTEFDSLNVESDEFECTFRVSNTLKNAVIYVQKISFFKSQGIGVDLQLAPYAFSPILGDNFVYGIYQLSPEELGIEHPDVDQEWEPWTLVSATPLWTSEADFIEKARIPDGYKYIVTEEDPETGKPVEVVKTIINSQEMTVYTSDLSVGIEMEIPINNYPQGSFKYTPNVNVGESIEVPFHIVLKNTETNQLKNEDLFLKVVHGRWSAIANCYVDQIGTTIFEEKQLVSPWSIGTFGISEAAFIKTSDLKFTEESMIQNWRIYIDTGVEEMSDVTMESCSISIDYESYENIKPVSESQSADIIYGYDGEIGEWYFQPSSATEKPIKALSNQSSILLNWKFKDGTSTHESSYPCKVHFVINPEY